MMIKSTKFTGSGTEVEIWHPLKEIGKISLFIFKLANGDSLYSIPHHHWSMLKSDFEKGYVHWPSSFQYSPYQEQLKSIMDLASTSSDNRHLLGKDAQ